MNKYRGSNFDDFLKEEGMLEDVSERAQKRLEALRVEDAPAGSSNGFLQWLKQFVNRRFPISSDARRETASSR